MWPQTCVTVCFFPQLFCDYKCQIWWQPQLIDWHCTGAPFKLGFHTPVSVQYTLFFACYALPLLLLIHEVLFNLHLSFCSSFSSWPSIFSPERNQALCSQLFPAALSLLHTLSCSQQEAALLCPAVTFMASCVASNGQLYIYANVYS